MIKAVLFDLDGTLVNSIDDLADSCNYALEKLGLPTHETEKFRYFVGNGIPDLMKRILPDDKRDTEIYDEIFEIFWERYSNHFVDKTCAYDGIKPLIAKLKEMGIKVAVISNKAEFFTLQVVEKCLGDVFDRVYGKREGYLPKPDPKLTLELLKDLGVDASECLLVGDSGMDMATSVNVGCKGVGVLWGFRTKDELLQNGADYIVRNPNEIIGIIKEINNEI